MGRDHTFYDSQQRNRFWDSEDAGQFVPNAVFVGMAFQGAENRAIYEAIVRSCASLKLHAKRIDESVGSGFIHFEIKQGIEDAEFCIFDLTGERPNVYYELGYAHGVGNEANDILLLAKAGTALHFDVAPLRINYYADIAELERLVAEKLDAMIRATRGRV